MDKSNSFPAAAYRAAQDYLPWYRVIRNQSRGEIWLLDDIGMNGITADAFARELKAFDGQPITLNINSNGGDVFQGRAIASLIKSHKAPVNARILGLAASIASIIAISSHKVSMERNSFMVLHNAWSFACGDAVKLKKVADDLTIVNETLIDTYLSRAKSGALDRETLVGWLNEEKWLNSAESFQVGFSDEIIEEGYKVAACFTDKARLANFKHVPESLAAAPTDAVSNELWYRSKQLELLF